MNTYNMKEESNNKITILIGKISMLVSRMLGDIQKCYKESNIQFPAQSNCQKYSEQYAFKLIMSIISPTKLQFPQKFNNYGIFYNFDRISQKSYKKQKISELSSSLSEQSKIFVYKIDNKNRRNVYLSGTKPKLDEQLQVMLADWILNKKMKGQTISNKQIRYKARQLSKDPTFLASDGWLRNYYKRHPTLIYNCNKIQKNQQFSRFAQKNQKQQQLQFNDYHRQTIQNDDDLPKMKNLKMLCLKQVKPEFNIRIKDNVCVGIGRNCTYFGDVNIDRGSD